MADETTELSGQDRLEIWAWSWMGRTPRWFRLALAPGAWVLLGAANVLVVLFEPGLQQIPTTGVAALSWKTWVAMSTLFAAGVFAHAFNQLHDYLGGQVGLRDQQRERDNLALRLGYYEELSERLTQSLVLVHGRAPFAPVAPSDLFDLVGALCKQIDDQVGGLGTAGRVTSNLMAAVPPERSDHCLARFRTLQPRADTVTNPYAAKFRAPISLDGCQDSPARATLMLVGGSQAFEDSIGAGGAWIFLRVPEREGWALPGAPRAFVRAEKHVEVTNHGRVFSYETEVIQYDDVADTHDIRRADDEQLWKEQIQAMEGFFKRVGHVRSFTSIALVRKGSVVGVLNINRDTTGLFADQDAQHLITSIVRPYLPLLSEVAAQLTTHLCTEPSA